MKLKFLLLATFLLFLGSLSSYLYQNSRATDLTEGSDFIKGLDIESIAKIELKSGESETAIVLLRSGERFVLSEHQNYPASTEAINDLLYKIASISVSKKLSDRGSEELLKKHKLGEKNFKNQLSLYSASGERLVRFWVGASNKGKGNYLLKDSKDDSAVYLSSNPIFINDSYLDYIDRSLLNLSLDDVTHLQVKDGAVVTALAKDDLKKEKASSFLTTVSSLRLEEYRPYESDGDLRNKRAIVLQTNQNLTYIVSLFEQNKKHYVHLEVEALEPSGDLSITQGQNDTESDEELKKVADYVAAQKISQSFSELRSPWLYQISPSAFETLMMKATELKN